jgi:EAL domain-containing protein (putative c-di-GMP-specific phosphodiesterase class I)
VYDPSRADAHLPMAQPTTSATRLREALLEGRFELYAQPIVALNAPAGDHHELLVRMRSPTGELTLPASFLDVAGRSELIERLDRWVAVQAIELLATAQARGRALRLNVNVSGGSVGDAALLAAIRDGLERTGVDPASLTFEVTETAAVANVPRARHFAEQLSELGCRFALDDFGAGFGSFYYLKHLPFDVVKLDGEFVRECTNAPTDQLIIRAIVEIARGLGKETIAECAEHQETVDYLRAAGVDYGQGFHLGRPVAVEELFEADAPSLR